MATALAQPVFKVWVFVGVQQVKVKFDLLDLVQQKGHDAEVIKMTTSGRNALDFHMSCYLGQLMTVEPDGYFHVIAKDTGMDPLLDHLREKGTKVWRWPDVFEIPIVKASAAVPSDEKLSRIVEYLVRRGKQRPATMKTLRGSVAALFKPKLEEAETADLVSKLQANGVFEVIQAQVWVARLSHHHRYCPWHRSGQRGIRPSIDQRSAGPDWVRSIDDWPSYGRSDCKPSLAAVATTPA